MSAARNAFSGWAAVPFEGRKAILAGLFNKLRDRADELRTLVTAEQRVTLAEARWEINLLTDGFGPALMQMELPENEQDVQPVRQITKRYVRVDGSDTADPRNLSVILSFGKVLPALLAGNTVVLIPSPFTTLTVLRISEYIRELFPPGVFNVVTGEHDLWIGMIPHSGVGLICFTRSVNRAEPASESFAGTVGLGKDDSRIVADRRRIALVGKIEAVPVNRKPGRHGLASTLFEILSFQPTRMKTQVLVWSLARKASYTFPGSRSSREEDRTKI
jgi:acyl-CoA reductase-like NAD-dependent aldehyde dehydrogenase